MIYLYALVFLLLLPLESIAALIETPVASLPTSTVAGATRIVIDGATEDDCSLGGGVYSVLCTFDGVDTWVPGGGGSTSSVVPTQDQVFDQGNVIDGATVARPFKAGDGTRGVELLGDATLGGVARPFPLGDSPWRCWATYDCVLRDEGAGGAAMLRINPAAATPLLMYQFQIGYRQIKSVALSANSMYGDGTNCPARPTIVTISNMQYPSFICTENDGSRLKFAIRMRDNWDALTVQFMPIYAQTAADTGSVALEAAAACRALGSSFNGTYGTQVEIDDAAVAGSGAIEGTLSAAITPNGTCAAGDMLYGYIDVDAADNPTTAAATLNFVGVEIFWTEISWSHK